MPSYVSAAGILNSLNWKKYRCMVTVVKEFCNWSVNTMISLWSNTQVSVAYMNLIFVCELTPIAYHTVCHFHLCIIATVPSCQSMTMFWRLGPKYTQHYIQRCMIEWFTRSFSGHTVSTFGLATLLCITGGI